MAAKITMYGKTLYEVKPCCGKGKTQDYSLYHNFTVEPYEGQVKWMTERIWSHAPKRESEALALLLNSTHDEMHFIDGEGQTRALRMIKALSEAAHSSSTCCDRGFFKKI